MFLSICDTPGVLKIFKILRIIFSILKIVVPLVLIVLLMVDYGKATINDDKDLMEKANKTAIRRIIAALVIFLVPTIVNAIFRTAELNKDSILSCLVNSTDEKIVEVQKETVEKKLAELEAKYNADLYVTIRGKINGIKDESVRNSLLSRLEAIPKVEYTNNNTGDNNDGGGIYNIPDTKVNTKGYNGLKLLFDPDDPDFTIEKVLKENGSSVEKLNSQIKSAVESAGIGTREASVAAGMTLINKLADYGYMIKYQWGGRKNSLGINRSWGKYTGENAQCKSHGDPELCAANDVWSGLDCRGFTFWVTKQAFNDGSYDFRDHLKKIVALKGQTTAVCEIGDLIENSGHSTLVVGIDNDAKEYIIAESGGIVDVGLGISRIAFDYQGEGGNDSSWECWKINYKASKQTSNTKSSTTTFKAGTSRKKYNDLEYIEVVPEGATKNLPLIIYLHGDDQQNNLESRYPTQFVESGEAFQSGKFIYIAPIGNYKGTKNNWVRDDITTALKSLIDKVVADYSINPNKIIITGFSRGSIGTWEMVYKYPTFFAAAVPVSCEPEKTYPSMTNFTKTTIYAFENNNIGDKSGCYEGGRKKDMSTLIQNIKAAGGKASLEIKDTDHSGMQKAAYTKSLFTWMISQTR